MLDSEGLSLDEYLLLLSIKYKDSTTPISKLMEAGEILELLLKKEWIGILADTIVLKKKTQTLVRQLNNNKVLTGVGNTFVKTFREKWRGLKLGSMGDFNACQTKLNR